MTSPFEPAADQTQYTPLRQAARWSILLNEAPGDDETRLAFEQWLDQSPAHAVAWADVGHVSQLLQRTPTTSLPARRRPRRWIAAASGMAAALVLVAVMGPSMATRLSADHVAAVGQEDVVALADGSIVRLAPGSAIKVDLTSHRRDVRLLAGEAYFEAAPDRARPFHVQTRDARVTVLGTGFNVRLGEVGTDVAVRHGRVRVDRTDDASVLLTDGEWSRAGSGTAKLGLGSPQVVGAWSGDRMVAVDQTVADMLGDARRRHHGAIILANGRLAPRTVTGAYDMRDPAAGLAVMMQPLGGKVRRITPWLIIVS
ncbi:FecR family protein [Brevundimonas faecalis]|uniref:FecR family protein n=1 Tax=Brevundimonas faecalis TaxID=947378 RepID=UPI003623048D